MGSQQFIAAPPPSSAPHVLVLNAAQECVARKPWPTLKKSPTGDSIAGSWAPSQ